MADVFVNRGIGLSESSEPVLWRGGEAKGGVVVRLLISLWMIILSFQFFDTDIEHVRIPMWAITILLTGWAMRDILRPRRMSLPSWGIVSTILFAVAWKSYSVVRSPGEAREVAIVFGDFLCVILVCIFVVPRYFRFEGWVRFCVGVYCAIFVFCILLHPMVPDNTEIAGWDKGQSWMFSHPNGAAMFALTIMVAALISISSSHLLRRRLYYICIAMIALGAIWATNSRTSEGAAIAVILVMIFGVTFGRLWRSSSMVARVLRYCFVFVSLVSICVAAFVIVGEFTDNQLDELSSGRYFFTLMLLQTVPNIWLGVGVLPPGDNLEFSKEKLGAGIDGLYANIVYTEGLVGLILYAAVLIAISYYLAKTQKRSFPYPMVIVVAALLNGLTETQFWLTPSPLTILALGSAAAAAVSHRRR